MMSTGYGRYYPYEFAPTLQDLSALLGIITIKPHPTITPIKQQLEFIFPIKVILYPTN